MSISCCFCNTLFPEKYNGFSPPDEGKINFFRKKKVCKHCNSLMDGLVFLKEADKPPEKCFKLSKSKKWLHNNIFCLFPYKFNVNENSSSLPVEAKKKCYKCFTKEHNTNFCDGNFTTPQLFQPKIDINLLQRFSQTLDPLEQYSFAFSSEAAFKSIDIKHLLIAQKMKLFSEAYFIPFSNKTNILITEEVLIRNIDRDYPTLSFIYNDLMTLISSKILLFNVKDVSLCRIEISAATFFSLISTKTTHLNFYFVEFTAIIKFSDIIKKLPNIISIAIQQTNIKFDKLWIETLLNNCLNLNYLFLPFRSIGITHECIPVYTKKNSHGKLKVYLNYNGYNNPLIQRLSTYPVELRAGFGPRLKIEYKNWKNSY